MTANNRAFKEFDVAKDMDARKQMSEKTKGRLAVPVVEIDGEVKVGYDEAWIKSKLGIK